MEITMETNSSLETTVERIATAASLLEQAMQRLSERQQESELTIGRISATVEAAMEERLQAAEAKIAQLEAGIAETIPTEGQSRRKTLPAGMASMLAKQGVTVESLEAGALDAALTGLSLEQRIAVKSQLLRAGMLV
jgi:predicted  nucleic acid-binding Zn-ribbon protein